MDYAESCGMNSAGQSKSSFVSAKKICLVLIKTFLKEEGWRYRWMFR